MPLSFSEIESLANNGLKLAKQAQSSGDVGREFSLLKHVLDGLLRIAVGRCDDGVSAQRFLVDWGAETIVDRVVDLNRGFALAASERPKRVQFLVCTDITVVHAAWLVDKWNAARSHLELCSDVSIEQYAEPLTGFWKEYHRAVGKLVSKQPYTAQIPKVKGYERYWVPYLHLIEDLTNGRDDLESAKEISESFERRNHDKRLIDWSSHDGDGNNPVRWDFRQFTICKCWQHEPTLVS